MASYTRLPQAPTKLLQRSRPQKECACEQVAAVCFRFGSNGIEFLLVRTRGGRWTFPKGRAESGLTHAQAAAVEAFEEAGVHGRLEEVSFACYMGRKRAKHRESSETRLIVHGHLCEVSRLDRPQESNRTPTWFSAEKAKRRLREERTAADGAELARVVDCAVARIQRVRSGNGARDDAFQKVQFEAFHDDRVQAQQAFYRRIRRQHGACGHFSAIALAVDAYLCKVLRLRAGDRFNGSFGLFSERRDNREVRPDRSPKNGTNLSLAAAGPAMPLSQLSEADGAASDGPTQLQIVRAGTRRGTQSAGRRRGGRA